MSVVSAARVAPYHHGDLRRTLLIAADDEIRAVGTARLSLRELARRAGVSHAAPAHHFRDKRGVFTALAAEGYRMLHERTSQVVGRRDALVLAGECYVAFAVDHPSHFTVMFDASLLDDAEEELNRERTTAFDNLFRATRDSTGADDDEISAQVTAAWAVVHGLATLWLGGNLPYPQDSARTHVIFQELAPALQRVAAAARRDL